MSFSLLKYTWLLPFLSTLFTPAGADQPSSGRRKSPFTNDFDNLVYQNLDYWHVPGFSIAVVDNNETFSKGYGISSFPSQNVTPSTLFFTASTTKAFTACALALLISDSTNTSDPLSWRTPISSLIRDDFVLPDDYATTHATLEDAASHRTGMPRHDASYGGSGFSVRDVVRSFRNLPKTRELREEWQYCNMMYMALSHVIETLTGQWLGDVLWERIWKPLNMSRTYFSLSHAKAADHNGAAELARGYVWNNLTREYEPLRWLDLTTISGAGAVISNVLDYAQWLRFLMDKAAPLPEAQHEELRTPRITAEASKYPAFTGQQSYGLGWQVANYRGEPVIFHAGGLPGFGALVGYLPIKKFGFAMMGNTAGTSNFVCHTLAFKLLDGYLSVREDERFEFAPTVEEYLEERLKVLRDPKQYLYPTAPNGTDALPLSRPLEAYTGLYSNPGYRNLTVHLAPPATSTGGLQSILGSTQRKPIQYLTIGVNRIWPFTLDFEHVSGEFFIARGYHDMHLKHQDMYDPLEIQLTKVEFRIGEDGQVKEMGALLEPLMGEKKIWFRKFG